MQNLLKLPAVQAKTCKTTSRIYAEMAEGTFPKPIKIGSRAVAWVESEIDAWIESKIADREAA